MKIVKVLLRAVPYLDDILFFCALGSFVAGSYLICPIAGTYTLGAALLAAACWAGKWLQSPIAKVLMQKIKKGDAK